MERIKVNSWQEATQFKDHTDRYQLAANFISPNAVILDAACGVGYGTAFLASHPQTGKVFGVDASYDAIAHAINHYRGPKTEFQRKNLDDDRALFHLKFDLVVCFETLEHLVNDRLFLSNIYGLLKPSGIFIVSVPNEVMIPFGKTPNPFHFRHYTVPEILSLLGSVGFKIQEGFCQRYAENTSTISREQSIYSNIFVCRKG
jgi:2-polyprenyl-3-methyl-5-hydroxy-6-metoxy-1,4-benzoquinol methylase